MLAGAPIAGAPIAGVLELGDVVVAPQITPPLFMLLDLDGRSRIVDNEGRTMTDFWIKRGDTSPPLRGQLLDGDLAPVDLTDATVRFKAKDRTTGAVVIDEAAVVDSATTGQVRYAWRSGDTSTEGELLGEFEVTFADSTIQTWPNPGYVAVHVTGAVAAA